MANLIDLYLGGDLTTTIKEDKPSSLTDMYLNPTGLQQSTTVQPESNIPTPEKFEAGVKKYGVNVPSGNRTLGMITEDVLNLPANIGSSTAEAFKSGVGLTASGLGDIMQGDLAPTLRGSPQDWKAGGVLKTAVGPVAAAMSPVSGVVKEVVEKPVTKLTGSSKIGEAAGFVAGSAIPVAPITRAISKAIPTNKAVANIVDAIGTENLPDVISRLKENPRLSIADVSPAVRQMSQKLITTEGKHQNKFEEFINDRISSAKGVTEDVYNSTMGIPVDVKKKIDDLKDAAKEVGSKQINPAVKASGPVDLTGVIKNIDDQLKPGVNQVISAGQPLPLGDLEKPLSVLRKFLTDDKSVRTDPSQLHSFQSALRAKADDLLNSTDGQSRQLGHALMNVRNQIVDAIDAASTGGNYKKSLAAYRDEMQIQDAFNKGQLVTRNRLGQLEDRPEFWKEWVDNASVEELAAAKEGARIAVDHQIKGMKFGARKGQEIPEIEFNKEKLSYLFGAKDVEEMAKKLLDERSIADTNSKLIQNSQTAMRMKSDTRVDLPVEKPAGLGPFLAPVAEIASIAAGGAPGLATTAIVGTGLARKGKHSYVDLPLAKAKNERMTDFITATGGDRDELIKILEQHLPKATKPSLMQGSQRLMLPVLPP